ncbi:CPBP family intramembrane metalloprotease, partial [Candidatus Woesearchaeota archaeon]
VIQRGLIQSKMSRYGTLATILVVSANFSLMHYMLGAPKIHIWSAVISVFFGSIVVVLLFEKTRNLFLTILVHLVYNCAVAYQIYLHAVNNTAAEIVFWTVYGIVFLLTAKHSWKILKGYAWLGKDFSVLDWIILPAYGVIFPLLLVFWTQVKAFLF